MLQKVKNKDKKLQILHSLLGQREGPRDQWSSSNNVIIIIIIIINNLFYVGKKKNMYIANKLINANKIG